MVLFGTVAIAASGEEPKHHIIIAVDQFVGDYKSTLLGNRAIVLHKIDKMLDGPNGKLLREGDYVSVVTFGLGTENRNFSDFVSPSTVDGKPIVWRPFESWDDVLPSRAWKSQMFDDDMSRFPGQRYTLLTASKPFTINALRSKDDDVAASRTFIIMISDDRYNGINSFQDEFNVYAQCGGRASAKEFNKVINEYNELFWERELARDTIAMSGVQPYQLILREVMPTAMPSLYSILDIPATFGLRRVPNGYEIAFKSVPEDDMYRLIDIEVTAHTDDGLLTANSGPKGEIKLFIPKGEVDENNIKVDVKASVLQKDGFYDGMIASADNPKMTRMQISRNLSVKSEGKIFGVRMPDAMWWFFPNDIAKAALLWEAIIIVLAIIIVIAIIWIYNKATQKYEVETHELKLDFKE